MSGIIEADSGTSANPISEMGAITLLDAHRALALELMVEIHSAAVFMEETDAMLLISNYDLEELESEMQADLPGRLARALSIELRRLQIQKRANELGIELSIH